MKKNVLGLVIALLMVTMLAIPVAMAKPTEAANSDNFLSFVWHSEGGHSVPVEGALRFNPPWATYPGPFATPGPDLKVVHDEAVWILNPLRSNYVQIGEDAPIPLDPTTGYQGYLYIDMTYIIPTYRVLNYKVYEKIMWDDNYVEIMNVEQGSWDSSGPVPIVQLSGIFTGTGIIDGQKVQVTGVREFAPGAVLESAGTIRFLGKAP